MKATKAYAIKNDEGEILFNTVRREKLWCRHDFTNNKDLTWDVFYKLGYRCVPVEITEIKYE